MAVSLLLVLAAAAAVSAKTVEISNASPRYTADGTILPAHDGNMLRLDNGTYLFYGMSYGLCKEPEGGGCSHKGGDPNCGFRTDHRVLVYASDDLSNGSWRYAGDALPVSGGRPEAIYFRPKVRYNPSTKLYVLWINAVPAGDFSDSFYVVATSPTPAGPFAVQRVRVPLSHKAPGDFDIFPDDDGKAYIIFTSVSEGHNISVELLTPDWLNSTYQSSGFFGETFVEAPAMFKENGTYYALFGHCCCFCAEGSGIGVYTAASPMGPYEARGNIGCNFNAGSPPSQVCPAQSSLTQAQQNNVFVVPDGRGGNQFIWTGDRWQSAPDKIKDHDFQYWTPLQFNRSASPPSLVALHHLDSFEITV